MLVVPFCTNLDITIGKFIFSADYVAVRFHRPGFDAPDYCSINQRFQLACLMKRVAPEIFFWLCNEKSPQLPAVGSIFPSKADPRLTLFGCQASKTDGDIQIKKRRTDENEQPHK